MSDNKFILQLKGTQTPKSVVEIKNDKLVAPFVNVPHSSDAVGSIIQDTDSSVVVAKSAQNWTLNGNSLAPATNLTGDGGDYTGEYAVSGNGAWVNASYVFPNTGDPNNPTAAIFNAHTKWVLRLCGKNLLSDNGDTITFSFIVKIGSTNIMAKTITVRKSANFFCAQFVGDFSESAQTIIKAQQGQALTVQLLCADATASATIYNGMTVLTALQRRVDADVVASDEKTFDDVVQDIDDINDEIDQIQEDIEQIQEEIGDLDFVKKTGDTMSGTLWFQGTSTTYKVGVSQYDRYSMRFTSATYGNGSFIMDFQNATLKPQITDYAHIGTSSLRWADAYINKVYTGFINNGYDIAVPVTNSADTLALKSEVDLAANSGRMITPQGFWYAKMDSATVAPAAEDGTNYADFSQVDGQGNPIIVTYNRVNGAWVQDQTIVPPADEDGYVLITSKIWDIPEQTGQQGGRVLWNHQSKEFTPYPQIVSFDGQNITNSTFSGGTITNSTFSGTATLSGASTVVMPQNPGTNQIVNKDYVDDAIGNGTITITQGGEPKGSFTTNQATPTTIELDQGGSGSGHNVGDTFLTTRTDNELNGAVECNGATYNTTDFTGSQSIGQLLSAGKVPYVSLATYATLLSTQGYCDRFGWDGTGTTAFRVPTLDLHHAVVEVLEPTSTDPYWYRRYADGWVEQGGIYVASANAANVFVPFPFSMADTNYTLTTTYTQPTAWTSNTGNTALNVTCRLAASTNRKITNGFYFNSVGVDGVYSWRVSGKASVGSKTLYQRAMVQLAVSATDEALETCTGVLANVAANTAAIAGADYVIESQLPTAANNYTWYRKYKSGWVEQGGISATGSGTSGTITLPVAMQDNNYTAIAGNGNNAANNYFTISRLEATTTTIKWYKSSSSMYGYWEVKGMAA